MGTVDATADFDAGFRPATDRVAARWQSIARAHRQGRPLPAISVLERPDGFYVLDGRHRVSVARALGHADIDAWTSPAGPVAHAHTQHPQPGETHAPPDPPRPRRPRRTRYATVHADEPVHFHAGDHGRPYVCEDPRCSSPSLTATA